MENVEDIRKQNEIINRINALGLLNINVEKVEKVSNYRILTINGGFNGRGHWMVYLHQIQQIIASFLDVWIIELNVDNLDDVWTLKLGIII